MPSTASIQGNCGSVLADVRVKLSLASDKVNFLMKRHFSIKGATGNIFFR